MIIKVLITISLVYFPTNIVFAASSWPLNDLTEADVNEVISKILENFSVEIAKLNSPVEVKYGHGEYVPSSISSSAEVSVTSVWDESTQDFSPIIHFNLSGTYTRFKTMTLDGVALIVCHELGHLIGGSPTFLTVHPDLKKALSAEGQADYFAASKCFHQYASSSPISNQISNVHPAVEGRCKSEFAEEVESEICMRSAMAGFDTLNTLNQLNIFTGNSAHYFSFSSPSKDDQSYWGSSLLSHPDYQCRLDTYLAGALCGNKTNCVDEENKRPKCWFVEEK